MPDQKAGMSEQAQSSGHEWRGPKKCKGGKVHSGCCECGWSCSPFGRSCEIQHAAHVASVAQAAHPVDVSSLETTDSDREKPVMLADSTCSCADEWEGTCKVHGWGTQHLAKEQRNWKVAQPQEVPAEQRETGWLIERADGQGPLWAGLISGQWGWVTDSLKAIRFARYQDAEAFATAMYIFANFDKITEHVWMEAL